MQNQKEPGSAKTGQNKQTKAKKIKKNGKIQEVWEMNQKGASVKEIAQKMKISERVVRSYLWRKKNPEKFKALLAKYQEKRKKQLVQKTNHSNPNGEAKQSSN